MYIFYLIGWDWVILVNSLLSKMMDSENNPPCLCLFHRILAPYLLIPVKMVLYTQLHNKSRWHVKEKEGHVLYCRSDVTSDDGINTKPTQVPFSLNLTLTTIWGSSATQVGSKHFYRTYLYAVETKRQHPCA